MSNCEYEWKKRGPLIRDDLMHLSKEYSKKCRRVFHSVSQFRIRTINLMSLYGNFHMVWQVSPEPIKYTATALLFCGFYSIESPITNFNRMNKTLNKC